MCYLIAKRMNKPGCIALQTEPGERDFDSCRASDFKKR